MIRSWLISINDQFPSGRLTAYEVNYSPAGSVLKVGRCRENLVRSRFVLQPLEINDVCRRIRSVGGRAVRSAAIGAAVGVEASVASGSIIDCRTIESCASLFKECAECVALPDGAASHAQVSRSARPRYDSISEIISGTPVGTPS